MKGTQEQVQRLVPLSTQLSEADYDRLREQAKAEDRSVASMARILIKQGLADGQQDAA